MNFRRVSILLGVAVLLIAVSFYIYGLLLKPFFEPTLDDNQWVGTWHVESVDGERFEQRVWDESFSQYKEDRETATFTNNWTFNDDGRFRVEAGFTLRDKPGGFISSWEGIYTLSGKNYRLIGGMPPAATKDNPLLKALFILLSAARGKGLDTGTWNRQGDTLTIISTERGEVMIFKKKK